MRSSQFSIDILDLYWINGDKDNPDDLCLHGKVTATIGNEMVAENYPCTVSSTALYLLKSIKLDHIMWQSANQMLPCCGFFIIPDKFEDTVEISGCPNGIDWSIIHSNGYVKLITQKGNEKIIELNTYKEIAFDFVDKIEKFYENCKEKTVPSDDFDRDGYIKFWREWHNRRYNFNN